MIFAVLIIVILVGLQLLKLSKRPNSFPPGPRGWPILGYIPFALSSSPANELEKLAKQYGDIVGFYLGPTQPFISVSGYEAVKEALSNEDLNGRPSNAARRQRSFGKRLGLTFNEGEFLQEHRRFTIRHLRDLGFGKTSSENMIQEEIFELFQVIKATATSDPEGLVDFQGIFNPPIINVLWAMIAGRRFPNGDEQLKRLLETIDTFFRSGNTFGASIPIPEIVLRNFPFLWRLIGIRSDLFVPLQDFIRDAIKDHENNLSYENPKDFIDIFLGEMKKQNRAENTSTFQEDQLISSIIDMFVAGGETTANAIGFTLLYMLYNPEIQKKLQSELDNVCGASIPSLAHRASLPYMEAVLLEVLRLSNVAPTTVPHQAMKDTHVKGYFIPKGSILTMNIFTVNMDATYWIDPQVFRPERHLDANGLVVKTDHMIPFGAGKRMCLGEPLARNSFYLFTAAFFKTFTIKPTPNHPLPTLEPLLGFSNE